MMMNVSSAWFSKVQHVVLQVDEPRDRWQAQSIQALAHGEVEHC